MRTYKLEVVTAFTDIHTKEKYKVGKKLKVDEERAFELFSSPYHLVKLISCDGDNDLESIKAENDELKKEISIQENEEPQEEKTESKKNK